MVLSQPKYDHVWCYSRYWHVEGHKDFATLDFNTNPVAHTLDTFGFVPIGYQNTSISNWNGNLLLYTNGCLIADNSHQAIPNGDSLNPGWVYNEDCIEYEFGYPLKDAALFLPLGNNLIDIILFHESLDFHLNETQDTFIINVRPLMSTIKYDFSEQKYHVVNKNFDLIPYDTVSSGNIEAIQHENYIDWWLVLPSRRDTLYYTFLVSDTIKLERINMGGRKYHISSEGGGQSAFSPDGTKYIRWTPYDGLLIWDFSRQTGEMSNYMHVDFRPGLDSQSLIVGGMAISPSGQFIYVSTLIELYQFDLWASDILESKELIAQYDGYQSPFSTTFYQMQLAPDCRIYMNANNGVDVMHVINNPDAKGQDCDFVQHGVQLPTYNGISIPNFPVFRFSNYYSQVCDSLLNGNTNFLPPVSDVQIWPNPVRNMLNIRLPQQQADKVILNDMQGKQVLLKPLQNTSDEKIDLSNLGRGIYILTLIRMNQVVYSEKLVKI